MATPLRSAILRGAQEPAPEQKKQDAPPPKPGLGALSRAIGRGKEVKKVTIVGGGGGAGDSDKAESPKHGSKHPWHQEDGANTLVWDTGKQKYVRRGSLGPSTDRVVIEK